MIDYDYGQESNESIDEHHSTGPDRTEAWRLMDYRGGSLAVPGALKLGQGPAHGATLHAAVLTISFTTITNALPAQKLR